MLISTGDIAYLLGKPEMIAVAVDVLSGQHDS